MRGFRDGRTVRNNMYAGNYLGIGAIHQLIGGMDTTSVSPENALF